MYNYSEQLRKIMYTTNAIESLNRTYRKYTKTKGTFPSDDALIKSIEENMTIWKLELEDN
jgi:transposase-like protein